jgi:hypothetical protein
MHNAFEAGGGWCYHARRDQLVVRREGFGHQDTDLPTTSAQNASVCASTKHKRFVGCQRTAGCCGSVSFNSENMQVPDSISAADHCSSCFCFAVCRWRATGVHPHFSFCAARYYLYLSVHSFRAGDGRWNGRPVDVILRVAAHDLCGDSIELCGEARRSTANVYHCSWRVMEWQHLPTQALFWAWFRLVVEFLQEYSSNMWW